MDITLILEIIGSLGFPIAAVIALCWFIWRIYKASEAREEKLREELKENREINRKFADIISKYSVEITEIKTDIKDIKDDIIIISEKIS
jgi:F0F1-type ATP synthase membrane subunit b/b'